MQPSNQPNDPSANQTNVDAPQVYVQSAQGQTTPPSPAASYVQPSAQAKQDGLVKGLKVGLVLVVVFAFGFITNTGLNAMSASNAKSAGKAMVAALVAGDTTKAYGLASANLRNQETASALVQSVGDVQTSKMTVGSENVQVNGKDAVYVASVDNLPANDKGETKGTFVVSLAKSGLNSWKVDDVSVQ